MNEQELKKLYDTVSKKFNVGTWEEFKSNMQTLGQRQRFYDVISVRFNIGDYDSYENRLSGKSSSVTSTQTSTSTSIEPSKVSSNFSCILNNTFWKPLVKSTNDSNHIMYTVNNITGKEFNFFADGKFIYNDVKPFKSNIKGTWECDGNSNFLIRTEDNALFDSKVNKWSYNVNETKNIKKIVSKNLKSLIK